MSWISELKRQICRWVRPVIYRFYRWARPVIYRLYLWLEGDLPRDNQATPWQTDVQPLVKLIDNLADLDAELSYAEKGFEISDDEGRRRLQGFAYMIKGDYPADPYSPEYAAAQMQMYLALSGRSSYSPEINERTAFDLEQAMCSPFPYATRSPSTVGEQLMAQGFLIRAMNLRPGARIVEFGPGWGNLTLNLAQMGYRVTAVEIEKKFTELIHRRANALGLEVDLVNQDMATFEPSEQYDAAVFFESFHHCADHLRLLRNLNDMVVSDGLAVFATEPIADFPHPWGFVTTGGFAAWSIRKYGWFEICFDTSYFLRTLLKFGWLPRHHASDVAPPTSVVVAHKSQGQYNLSELTLPPDEAATWASPGPGHRLTTAKSVMSCAQFRPVKAVEFCLSNPAPSELEISLSVGATRHRVKLPRRSGETAVCVEADNWQGQVTIASQTWSPPQARDATTRGDLGVAVHWFRLLE